MKTKPHYRLTYRDSSHRGRTIAYFIPIRGADFVEVIPQWPMGRYCREVDTPFKDYGYPIKFKPLPTTTLKKWSFF